MVFCVPTTFTAVICVAAPIPVIVPAIVVIAARLTLRSTTVLVAAVGEHTGGKTKESVDQQVRSGAIEGIHGMSAGVSKANQSRRAALQSAPAVELLATLEFQGAAVRTVARLGRVVSTSTSESSQTREGFRLPRAGEAKP
jgi:hypothetical protein